VALGDDTLRDVRLGDTRLRDPLLGLQVGDYLVQELVGQGAMGIVYKATHSVIGKPVAIKVLKPDFADDPDMVQRLIREARTVNAIRHPGIVDIFGFGTLPTNGQPYIVMDLLVGEPLDVYVKREAPVTLKVAWPMLDELLSALEAAHQVGVVHRDLKPGNVFLEKGHDGRLSVKVIDFGLARQAEKVGGSVRPTNPGTLLGTPAFMAPEQITGEKLSAATDLYAVGGIAYQLLTGHLPHEAPSAIEVLSQKLKHDPIRPRQWVPTLDEELDAWVMSLLGREMETRPQTATEARRQLRRLAEGRTHGTPAVALGASPVPRTGVVPRRQWAEARTVLVDPEAAEPTVSPVERTTDNFVAMGHLAAARPTLADGQLAALTPAASPSHPPMPRSTVIVEQVPGVFPETQPLPELAALRQSLQKQALQKQAEASVVAPAPERGRGLMIALGVLIAVLVVALVFLLR
jgi:serine/threonine-protein kinase